MHILIKFKNIKNIDVCYVSGHNKVFQRSILGAYAACMLLVYEKSILYETPRGVIYMRLPY